MIPDYVRRYCRPEGIVDPQDRQQAIKYFASEKQAKAAFSEPFLFADMNEAAQQYLYKEHFRNQLKARLLPEKVSTKVLREGTLENLGPQGDFARDKALEKLQSQIVWNIATAAFYTTGGRPWKVSGIREGVCYIGLVFKKDDRGTRSKWASCGAQMFLDSGDGLVFKGAPGNWFNAESKSFHLSYGAAKDLISQAVQAYKLKHENQTPPKELFIHGRVAFSKHEWQGFLDGAGRKPLWWVSRYAMTPVLSFIEKLIRRFCEEQLISDMNAALFFGLGGGRLDWQPIPDWKSLIP